jgi:regulator of sigma E protease
MAIDLLLALSMADLIWWIDVIVKVAIALGTVVFVHELGHFLMAKACGVKVEKFMLGFDIGGYKIAKRFGETVYGIGILPLGGYVKMFGQDDDPSHIAEQMAKSQVAANSADAVEKTGPNGEKYYLDRRSYLAKSVPQRMAIISAGVIMNVIFAFIFATIAYGMGVKYLPCIVSGTMPGSPAWKAGFETGDEIVQLGDRTEPTFLQLKGGVTLGNLETGIPCEVKLASTGEVVERTLLPTQEEGDLPTVGIGGPTSLKVWLTRPSLAASQAKLISATSTASVTNEDKKEEGQDPAKVNSGDVVISVNDTPVETYREYVAELVKATDKPMTIEVRRPLKSKSIEASAEGKPVETESLTFEVPPQPMRGLGLVMKIGPVTVVQDNSPAEKAGVKVGDLIVAVDGIPTSLQTKSAEGGETAGEVSTTEVAAMDPMVLPEYLQKAAIEGREVEFTVQRRATGKPDGEVLTLRMKPEVKSFWILGGSKQGWVPWGLRKARPLDSCLT